MFKLLTQKTLLFFLIVLSSVVFFGYFYQLETPEVIKIEAAHSAPLTHGKKMHKYRLNKLWRDKTVADLIERDGAIIDHYRLNDDEYRVQIGLKLKEEAAEVDEAMQKHNKQELAEEIADVFEVLDCIIAFNDLEKSDIEGIQAEKRQRRGSFMDRDFVTIAQAVDGSYLHNYYLKSPDRHQEIMD